MSSIRKAANTTVVALFTCYFISAVFAVPYFNYQYAKKNGFWSWLFFGEIVATMQASIWPYFAFRSDSNENIDYIKRIDPIMRVLKTDSLDSVVLVDKAKTSNDPASVFRQHFEVQVQAFATKVDELKGMSPPEGCKKIHALLITRLELERDAAKDAVVQLSKGLQQGVSRLKQRQVTYESDFNKWFAEFQSACKDAGLRMD